jgi:hypothetical protein
MLVAISIAIGAFGGIPIAEAGYAVCAAYTIKLGSTTVSEGYHCAVPTPWSSYDRYQQCRFIVPVALLECTDIRLTHP